MELQLCEIYSCKTLMSDNLILRSNSISIVYKILQLTFNNILIDNKLDID